MMKENHLKGALVVPLLSLIFSVYTQSVEASLPKFNLVEDGATIEQVPVNGSVSARYTLTNNMKREVTLALQPMTGVTQDTSGNYCPNPIVLAAKASCTLALTISGSAFASEADGAVVINNEGPVVCNRISGGTTGAWCSQPLPSHRLNITKVGAEQVALALEPSSITITEGAEDGSQTDTFTITNNSQTVTASEVKVTGVLPGGVTQNVDDCQTILPKGSCSLPLTADSGAAADTYAITIAGSNTQSLQADVIVEAGALNTCGGVVACGVFVSSEAVSIPITENGADNGRDAADAICQRLASAAGLERASNYRAWLSIVGSNAIDHVGYVAPKDGASGTTYVRAATANTAGQVTILSGNSNLADGKLDNTIGLDENGNNQAANVWTGTKFNGTYSGFDCADWKSQKNNQNVYYESVIGQSTSNTSGWNSADFRLNCDQALPLYCFESPN